VGRRVNVGDTFKTNQGCQVTVVDYVRATNVEVIFESGFRKRVTVQNLLNGQISNPFLPTVYGVGYFGDGPYKAKVNRNSTREYNRWNGMIERCYSKIGSKLHITYKDCYVCEDWLNFQSFASWVNEQDEWLNEDWQLDKDLLVPKNKVYSPDTCVFLPEEINTFLILGKDRQGVRPGVYYNADKRKYIPQSGSSGYLGAFESEEAAFRVYVTAKEKRAKVLADKWSDLISDRATKALLSFRVEDRL